MHRLALGLAVTAAITFGSPAVGAQGADSAIVRGTVYDSVHHAPVAGTTVIAAADRGGSVRTIATDSRGHFEWSLAAGRYTLSVDDPKLDSARIEIAPQSLNAVSGGTYSLTLATPSVATRVRLACGKPQRDTTQGAIIGVVTDANSGRPIAGATVAMQWSDFSVDRAGKASTMTITRGATTDATGHFRACGVPILRSVALQAQVGSANSGIVEEQVNQSGVLIRELRVSVPLAGGARPATALVSGTIQSVTGAPVRDGRVILVGTTRGAPITDGGRFALDSVPSGTQQIEVLAIGYYPERVRLDLTPGARNDVHVNLETIAAVMDTLVIIAHANDPRFREFDRRRTQAYGQYITSADIAKHAVFRVSDLFSMMPHFYSSVGTNGARTLSSTGFRGIGSLYTNRSLASSDPNTTPQCPLLILNGGPVDSIDDIDAVAPSQIYGIEVYAEYEPVPAPYQNYQRARPGLPPPSCGAIIVWTK